MRNKKLGIFLLFTLLFISLGAKAQKATALRINEVLVVNEDNFMDNFGKRHAWIELFNSSPGPVNVGGCYLTNDKNNPMKYSIPKGDVETLIQPHQHVLFWADNKPSNGTFHINFELDPAKDNYIALYDADGITLIDEIVIPAGQVADVSYGRTVDGKPGWAVLDKVTPSTNNVTLDTNDKIDNFKNNDSWGIGMTITAMAVVFTGLFLLFLCFKFTGKLSIAASKRNARKAVGGETIAEDAGQESGEIFAAIAMALYEISDDNHDIENTVLTIRKVKESYSPWNSKIYSMLKDPRK